MIAPARRYPNYERQFTQPVVPPDDESKGNNEVERLSALRGKLVDMTLAHPVGAIFAAVAFGAVLGFVTKRLKR